MSNADYQQFASLLRAGRLDEALAYAESRAAGSPAYSAGFWFTQQATVFLRRKDYTSAFDRAARALRARPGDPYALLAAADARLGMGATAEARSLYEQAIATGPARPAERASAGLLACLEHRKEWQAILSLLPALPLSDDDRGVWHARALKEVGRTDEAIELCRQLLSRRPDYPRALWLLTDLEVEREGLEPVRQRLGRLARIPSRPPIYGEIYASLCRRAGVESDAVGQYEKLHAQTGDIRLVRKKAFALAKGGHEEEAMGIIEQLLRADPTDQYLHSSYGAAARRAGKIAQAVAFYRALLAEQPQHKGLYGRIRRLERLVKERSDGTA